MNLPDAPQAMIECAECFDGYIRKTVHVYEAGCGFSHPDVDERQCEACRGLGFDVADAEPDA